MALNLTKKLFSALAIAALLFAGSAYAEKGLLWKMEAPSGKISYLFGTMHADDARINDFSPAIQDAMKASETYMMETLPARDPSIYFMPEGTLLKNLLTDAEYEKFKTLTEYHVMHDEAANRMKPWLLAVVFDLPKPDTGYSQDALLYHLAESQGKEALGLEDTLEHFASLDALTLDEQLTMLRAVLKRTQADKERDYELLLNAYLTGDATEINKLDDKITGGMLPKALWAKMRVKLLDERNVIMAKRAAEQANSAPTFIAMGASHLPGDNGVIALLRKAQFKLTVIQ